MKYVAVLLLLLAPSLALAATATAPQVLDLSTKAHIGGATVPLGVVVSTENTDIVLSSTNKDGSTPVTFTLYLVPKPKPPTDQTAAAVDSSQNIQQAIANLSPAVAQAMQPTFAVVDAARAKASDALDPGISWAKSQIQTPGQVLSAQTQKTPAGGGIGGTLWTVMATLVLYILSILQFIIGNSGIFYPLVAVLFFYILWRLYRRYRRPAWQR